MRNLFDFRCGGSTWHLIYYVNKEVIENKSINLQFYDRL